MKTRRLFNIPVAASLLALVLLALAPVPASAQDGVEASYHGHLGLDSNGLGMLQKWCALPNFSFEQQEGIDGWTSQSCNACHIGASWNETKPFAKCTYCHQSELPVADDGFIDRPTIDKCLTCHWKDTAKRGDVFTPTEDVHIAEGLLCQDCHLRTGDMDSDHQFLKGTAIDTTEPTMKGTLSCTAFCHAVEELHSPDTDRGEKLNAHLATVACETCHTGLRPAAALESRTWNVFTEAGKPVTVKRDPGWLPVHKWYDNTGPGESGNYDLPILGFTERRGLDGAKIYPFNPVTVDWFVKDKKSEFDDVIIVPEVKAADDNGDRTVTVDEMRLFYKKATLKTADMNFSISHSVVPAALAFDCNDCHGRNGWVIDWRALGYVKDPKGGGKGGKKK